MVFVPPDRSVQREQLSLVVAAAVVAVCAVISVFIAVVGVGDTTARIAVVPRHVTSSGAAQR